jgi:hypothetical protein
MGNWFIFFSERRHLDGGREPQVAYLKKDGEYLLNFSHFKNTF